MKKNASLFIIFVLFFLTASDTVHAGFGITPPYVRNASLTRNSVYEQEILLVRSDPTTDLEATITLDVPGINDWFKIVEGRTILLPQGEETVPMTVRVTVPDDADFKQYTGNIRIKTGAPDDQVESGSVSISLGAQVDVEMTVIDKEIRDFRVRRIGISDLNEGHTVGWLYFPGKIRFDIFLENLGNVPVAPTEVVFRIYDPSGNVLLEETRNKGDIKKVDPFETHEVTAHIPTHLPAGSYLARFQIKNGDEIKREGELNLSILPYGTLQTAGFGFFGLSLSHKLSVIVPTLFLLGLIGLIVYNRFWHRSQIRKRVLHKY